MANMVTICCAWCNNPKTVRAADVARGWAKFCSKACKAKEQEARTGQYSALLRNGIQPVYTATGGLRRGEMAVIVAVENVGRSVFLTGEMVTYNGLPALPAFESEQ
jgi:hypothetical protein